MVEIDKSVAIKSFNLPADKYHIGAGMFNGTVEIPADMRDIPGHEYGCGLRSVAIIARLYLDHPSDETIVNTVSAAGYDKYWGMENYPHIHDALEALNFPHKPTENMPLCEVIDAVSGGAVAILNSTGPLWAHSDAPGESLKYRGDIGHLLVAVNANKETFVMLDSEVAQCRPLSKKEQRRVRLRTGKIETEVEDIAGPWVVNALEFEERNWTDFLYSSKPESGETVEISTCGDVVYSGANWKRRQGFVVWRPELRPYTVGSK